MTKEAEAETPPEDETPVADAETPSQSDGDNAADVEAEALEMGWQPKDRYKGDPENFVDAATYVKRANEVMPILRNELSKMRKENADLKRTMTEASAYWSRAEKRAYDAARRDLESRMDEAAEAGDVAGVRAARKEMADLTAEVGQPKPEAPQEPPELTAWKEDNPWFEKDAAMRGAVIAIADELNADGITDINKQIREINKRIREEFPHKFENPNRKAAAAVESANNGGRRQPAKSFDNLPPDAKRQADSFHRMGVFGKATLAEARAEYAKNYDWS